MKLNKQIWPSESEQVSAIKTCKSEKELQCKRGRTNELRQRLTKKYEKEFWANKSKQLKAHSRKPQTQSIWGGGRAHDCSPSTIPDQNMRLRAQTLMHWMNQLRVASGALACVCMRQVYMRSPHSTQIWRIESEATNLNKPIWRNKSTNLHKRIWTNESEQLNLNNQIWTNATNIQHTELGAAPTTHQEQNPLWLAKVQAVRTHTNT